MNSQIEDIKSHIRDINLELLINQQNIKIDISRRFNNKFRLFYPSRKLINIIIKNGGVLIGSRAIRCFLLNDKPILDRKVDDWDFLITQKMAYNIYNDMGYCEIPNIGETISIKNQRMWRHPDYDEAYRVGIVDVQMIVTEDIPKYIETEGIRIADLSYCISSKLALINDLDKKISNKHHGAMSSEKIELIRQLDKHRKDLNNLIIKFNCIKCLEN